MTEFMLPFPPTQLSPNARLHWAKVSKWKKAYKHACWEQVLLQKVQVDQGDCKLKLELVFHRPIKRSMDLDNLLARMKSGLDGVCLGLKIDDKRFDPVVVSIADEVGGFVMVKISKHEDKNGIEKTI
jgi:crossover junction endodeoxyribonuclease RusA